MKNKNRLVVLLVVLVVCVVLYFSGVLAPPGAEVEVKFDRFARSNYHFVYEHWKEKKLELLRRNEDFNQLKAPNQLGYFLALCDWTHRQWEHSVPDPYPLSNAVDILADIRSGKTGGFCGQYVYVLGDVLKSLGFFAVRYVELWSNRAVNKSHFVLEVWVDQYRKWMALDPDYNIYYEVGDTGVPANAYEIRQALFGKEKVTARSAAPGKPDPEQRVFDDGVMDLYANFAVSLRSDLMRHPKPLTVQDRFAMFLFFRDANTLAFFSAKGPEGVKSVPYAHITERKEDLYYDCNYARVEYEVKRGKKDVRLSFFTDGSMPNFKGFMVSGDLGKTWTALPGNSFLVKGGDGPVRILAAPVNMYDRKGCLNDITIKK